MHVEPMLQFSSLPRNFLFKRLSLMSKFWENRLPSLRCADCGRYCWPSVCECVHTYHRCLCPCHMKHDLWSILSSLISYKPIPLLWIWKIKMAEKDPNNWFYFRGKALPKIRCHPRKRTWRTHLYEISIWKSYKKSPKPVSCKIKTQISVENHQIIHPDLINLIF